MTLHKTRSGSSHPYALAAIRTSALGLLLLSALAGCSGSVASQLPSFNPEQNAAKAMELCDRNADGKLVTDELRDCPSLLSAMAQIDRDSNRTITKEELQSRFEQLDSQSDVKTLDVSVTFKKNPLPGAKVTFTPEPFMGDGLQSYSCVTTEQGRCDLIGSEVDLYGVPLGHYKVDVVHEANGIRATRGVEVADDAPFGNRLEIAL